MPDVGLALSVLTATAPVPLELRGDSDEARIELGDLQIFCSDCVCRDPGAGQHSCVSIPTIVGAGHGSTVEGC